MKAYLPATLVLLTGLSSAALSHHSFTVVYDGSRTVSMEGVVTDYRLINPHALMTMDVIDGSGAPVTWTVEMAGRLSLTRHGWADDTVAVGDRVTVIGNPMHSGGARIFLRRLVRDDGSEVVGPGPSNTSELEDLRRQRAERRDREY